MKRDIANFVAKCSNCDQVKAEHRRPGGLSQDINIPTWKWEVVTMDFIVGFPCTKTTWFYLGNHRLHDKIISLHFCQGSFFDGRLCHVKEVVKLHSSLIYHFCWSTQFASHFWKAFQKGLGTKFKLNTTSHSRTYGKVGNTIQTLDDMLRECVIYFKGNCDDHLPLIEFVYNNCYHSSITMTLFETLHGRKCRSTVGCFKVGEFSLIGPEVVYKVVEEVQLTRDRLKTSKS